MARIRHSKAVDELSALGDEQLDGYRAMALADAVRLADMVGYCAEREVKISESMAHRDRMAFRAEARSMELAVEQIKARAEAARQIVAAMADEGGVATMQAATVQLYTQGVFDWLSQGEGWGVEDLTRVANLGKALASLTGSEIQRYKAEVERRAREHAERAKQIASKTSGQIRKELDDLAAGILSVGG